MCTKKESVIIRDIHDLTLQIMIDSWWTSTTIGSNVLLPGILLDTFRHADFICTMEYRRPAALASYVSFTIKLFIIHQNMGPAQYGRTCGQKLTSQSYMN